MLLVAVAAMATAQAGEKGKTCAAGKCATATCASGECASGDCESCKECASRDCESCKECPIAAAMKKLPQMTFAVGDEKTCCAKKAATLATQSSAPVQFVVAGKTYAKESDAKLALVEETEKFVSDFASCKTCKVSGTITVAAKKHCCSQSAEKTASLVKAAMDNVQLTYQVGQKKCHCPIEAKKLAEKNGAPTLFVVADEKTQCNVTARLNLARAKYRAAVKALVQSQAKEKSTGDET